MAEYENLVPDNIIEGNAQTAIKASTKTKTSIAKYSNFLITINPNYSAEKISTPELRKEVGGKLIMLHEFLKKEFTEGRMLKKRSSSPDDWKCPPVDSIGPWKLEVGDNKGWIHMHFMASFHGEVHIDVNAVRAKSNEVFGQKTHVDVKYYKDNNKILHHYVGKQDGTSKPPKGSHFWGTLIPEPEIN